MILITILFLILNWGVIYFLPKKIPWLLINYSLIGLSYYFGLIQDITALIYILIWLFIGIILIIAPIRKKLITKYLMFWFSNRIPKLSKTETEALSAGDFWMEASVFQGKPDWKSLNQLKINDLTPEEKSFLDNETNILCSLINDWEVIHKDHNLSVDAWQYIKNKGFCGLTIAREFGGKGFSASAISAIVQKIASNSFTAGVTVMVPNSLGLGELFSHFGTNEQKHMFLPDLATGKHIACFALTGPETGSDASSIPDIGKVCYSEFMGQQTLGIKINFNKRYITLAPIATLVGLAFKLVDPDNLLKGNGHEGITCCYIPRDHPGLIIGNRHYPCGMPIMNGPLKGENVFIPIEWIIGGQKMAGQGWSILMSALSTGRAISLPAISQGITTTHYLTSSAYSLIRHQFGQSIVKFEGIEATLAQIGGLTYLAESARILTCAAIDNGRKPSVASAITKYHNTEIGRIVVNLALDIHGGRGVMDGPSNYLTGHYRGLLISITGEGANIMTRSLIIYGQAMTRCHLYLPKLMQAITDNDLHNFDRALRHNIGHSLNNLARSTWLLISKGILNINLPKTNLTKYIRTINCLSANFAVISDISILFFGGKLKQKERISGALADMLSYLYLSLAVIKYNSRNNASINESNHAKWALEFSIYKFQEAYFEVLTNFPNRYIAFILKIIAFPFGRKFNKPSHILDSQLATNMQEISNLRNIFKQQIYIKDNIKSLEEAFLAKHQIQIVQQKLDLAIKAKKINRKVPIPEQIEKALFQNIITKEDASLYLEFWNKYWQAIAVDVFDYTLCNMQ